jgi:4-hydroxythreonine-4-phosphate dehydrogenase
MRVYVTQGHEKGIGLEVFFKSVLMFSRSEIQKLEFIGYRHSVETTLNNLAYPHRLTDSSIELSGSSISCQWLKEVDHSESFTALNVGMTLAEKKGVLYTLPTAKDQFPHHAGHTEYFRDFYQRQDLGMFFSSPSLMVLLLSDHVPVNKLSEVMTEELIFQRLETACRALQDWQWPLQRVLVSGLNPHAGESGLIGTEDARITNALQRLRDKTKYDVSGPYPGDTMLLEKKSAADLLVYLFHDQGLGLFKGLQGFIGSNITLGLPYPRLSPDHGTSFGLFGKNQADYRGCAFSLREAITLLEKTSHGKDSSHQGQSSQPKKR